MKNIVPLLVLFLSYNAFGLIRLGIEGGLSDANLSASSSTGTVTNSTDPRTGFAGGASMDLGFDSGLSLQVDGMYVQKGFGTQPSPDTITRLDFFEVPVYLRYTLDIPVIKPFIGVGPYIGFSVNQSTAPSGGVSTPIASGIFGTTDFGLTGEIGADLYFTPFTSIFVSLRYDLGLTNLNANATTSSIISYHTRDFLALAGLMFGF